MYFLLYYIICVLKIVEKNLCYENIRDMLSAFQISYRKKKGIFKEIRKKISTSHKKRDILKGGDKSDDIPLIGGDTKVLSLRLSFFTLHACTTKDSWKMEKKSPT